MTTVYPKSETFRTKNGTIVSRTIHGPNEISMMSFCPKAQAILASVEIKGVQLRNSTVK